MREAPTVSSYMTTRVHVIAPDARISEAHTLLREYAFSALPVVDAAGVVLGVISRTDLLRAGRSLEHTRRGAPLLSFDDDCDVARRMTRPAVSVRPDAPLVDAAASMLERHVHRVLVVDAAGALVGVLSTKDLMAAVRDARHPALLGDFMSAPVQTVEALDTVAHATDRLNESGLAGLVVMEDGRPTGLFTQTEALQARDVPASTAVEEVMSYAMLCLDRGTRMHRAAAHALATRARRVVVVDRHHVCGVVTGMDFARALRAR
ncbi:MAG: CBS domain-containing protein [Polyangiales bacterium]